MITLSEKIKSLPEKSGVYIMRDISGAIIYIGKAVVLKNRVKQYFSSSEKLPKVQAMVDNIADFDYIITLSEKDALALEANLVKKHKPRYNILLKDDKSSPYIKINLKEEFPRMEITRKVHKDGARYFGPYFNGVRAKEIVEIVKSAYKMRACPKGYNQKHRECLNYHIELCLAPCQKRVDKEGYTAVVHKVMAFLAGRDDTAEKLIEEKMLKAVEEEAFERAILYRNQLSMLSALKERNLTDLGVKNDIDAFSIASDAYSSVITVTIVRSGKMMGVKNFPLETSIETESDALTSFIIQYYSSDNIELPNLICLENEFDTSALNEYLNLLNKRSTEIVFPKIGTKKKLVEMAKMNANDYLEKSQSIVERERRLTTGAVDELKQLLQVPRLRRMECYDISHISGTDKVASGVVFYDGTASKSDYRRYKIKTVEGNDDFACMAEVIKRRITRLKNGDEKFGGEPDLIVIDGGKGQLSSACVAMKNEGIEHIKMIALAERDEEIFTLNSNEPIRLPKTSYALKLLQRIRDEAHRFALTYHQNLRSKRLLSSYKKPKKDKPK